ncbi:MAG: hypothetical protein ABL932_00810 [Terricaulis sp.]
MQPLCHSKRASLKARGYRWDDGDRSYNELLDAFRDANRRLQTWIAAL